MKKATECVQAGWTPAKGEPRALPIYQSTTFKYENSDQMARLFDLEESGYFYSRLQNPTNDAVAAKIAALEGGVAAMLTSIGLQYLWRCHQSVWRDDEENGRGLHVFRPRQTHRR